jgi:hypothetical protein
MHQESLNVSYLLTLLTLVELLRDTGNRTEIYKQMGGEFLFIYLTFLFDSLNK